MSAAAFYAEQDALADLARRLAPLTRCLHCGATGYVAVRNPLPDGDALIMSVRCEACGGRGTTSRRARALAFDLVRMLLVTFTPTVDLLPDAYVFANMLGALKAAYDDAMADEPTEHQSAADKLAARIFAHGSGPRWPFEFRIAYDCAEALRRACAHDVVGVLPLIVRGAERCLTESRAGPERVEGLVQQAIRDAAKAA